MGKSVLWSSEHFMAEAKAHNKLVIDPSKGY